MQSELQPCCDSKACNSAPVFVENDGTHRSTVLSMESAVEQSCVKPAGANPSSHQGSLKMPNAYRLPLTSSAPQIPSQLLQRVRPSPKLQFLKRRTHQRIALRADSSIPNSADRLLFVQPYLSRRFCLTARRFGSHRVRHPQSETPSHGTSKCP